MSVVSTVPSTSTATRSTGPCTVIVVIASPAPSVKPRPEGRALGRDRPVDHRLPGVRRRRQPVALGDEAHRHVEMVERRSAGRSGASLDPEQIAVRHVLAERGVLLDEAGEELVQPLLDDILDLRLGQLARASRGCGRAPACGCRRRAPAGRGDARPGPGNAAATAGRRGSGSGNARSCAGCTRRRRTSGRPGRTTAPAAASSTGRCRSMPPDHVGGRQQHVVFHVEQPRGVVAALEIVAEVQEVVAVVLQVRALGRPAQQRALALGPVAELRQQRLRSAAAARARRRSR